MEAIKGRFEILFFDKKLRRNKNKTALEIIKFVTPSDFLEREKICNDEVQGNSDETVDDGGTKSHWTIGGRGCAMICSFLALWLWEYWLK